MKFLQVAFCLIAGSQAIQINNQFDHPVTHVQNKYHDDFDNNMPTKKELDEQIANGTATNTTPGANTTQGVNCTAFMNATLEELEQNFTELFTNFTAARAPVAVKAGNMTVNATTNPDFVNVTLFSAANLQNLTKQMKNITDFLVKYKKRLVNDGDINDTLKEDLEQLSKKNITSVKNYVNYTQKVLLETPLLKYISENFTDTKLNTSSTVVLTNVTINAAINATLNATTNETVNATAINVTRTVVPADITAALNNLTNAADKFVELDGPTYKKIQLAWEKHYVCNGTVAARAAAINATKNPNKTNATNATTCSANHTRILNETNATNATVTPAADDAAPALVSKKVPVNVTPAKK